MRMKVCISSLVLPLLFVVVVQAQPPIKAIKPIFDSCLPEFGLKLT